jgi:Bax protein
MGILRFYQHGALALIAVSVVALYGAAIMFPGERPQKAAMEWIDLPDVTPPAPLAAALTPVLVEPLSDVAVETKPKPPTTVAVAGLRDKFDAVSFELDAVRQDGQPVPRLFVATLPHDFKSLAEVSELKRTFIKMVLPLALKVNEEILDERHQLLLLHKKIRAGRELSQDQQAWLAELAARYNAPSGDLPELIRRVDAISPAMAVAQSAEESGWGRSRFALKGNALFGQRTWDKGSGIVPQRRDDGSRHEVRAFPSLLDSVRSYARNLNGHPAYRDFRARRAEMRTRDGELDPYRLIETLAAYSERRERYVQTIRKILRVDNLQELEDTQLESRPIETTQVFRRSSQR